MGHTYTSILLHVVFSTKERQKLMNQALRERLFPYIAGIAQTNRFKAINVGGVEDHVHCLLSLPPTLLPSKAVQLVKGGSSKWIHDTFPEHARFAWQQGYTAFSVSISHLQETIAYINNQEQHHKRHTFEEEFIAFLKNHGIEYDERYVWG